MRRHIPVILLMLAMLATAAFAQDRGVSYTAGSTNLRSLAEDANTEIAELYRRAKVKCTATGTNTIACASPSAAATAYADGMTVSFIPANSITGAATLNLDGLGAVTLYNSAGSALGSGDLVAGTLYTIEYRSTGPQWRVVSTGASGGGGGAAVGADYLQLSNNATNTGERVFTPGTGLSGTDAGANGTYTLAISDVELLAIAGLTSAADRLPYFTGSGTASLATFTSAGRALVDDADATAQRSTLGLVIGTNVQAQDTELSALGGLTSAADTLPYFNGAGTATTTTLTATGRSILDDASTSAVRTTLGLVIGTDVQAQDGELAAIAGLTSAADTAPYFTGSGTAALLSLTAAGRAILDDANAAAQRTTLGLIIGTDIQAYDADLAAIAGLTSAANALPYFTGAGTAATTTLSSAGRDLIDDADAAAQRATLGLVIGTNVQAYDGELAALSTLTSAADALPYFTGAGTAGTTTFTAAGRALVDDANSSAMRTTLGLAIGTDVQAYDAELASIAGLISAADRLPYFTGSGTSALATFTTAGRALVDDADAAAQRTTLGLGSISTQASSSVSITGGSITGITDLALADGGTGASLADPNADRLLWWDDSDGAVEFMALADIATEASPASGDYLLMMDAAGVFSKVNWSSLPAGGGGVSDGDKGDIVVSGSGSTWVLDQATAVTAFGSGDSFPCYEGGVLKSCAYSDLPGAGGGIANVVEDATPQLGGQLDVNTFALGDGTRELLTFVEDASAVNNIEIENNATGSPAILRSTGDDTNVDLRLEAKGTGAFTFEGSTIWTAGNDGSGSGLDADTLRATTPSATGLSILSAADAAAVRTLLDLEVGLDVQAYDADLSALAGVTSGADTLPYFTGAGTASTTTLTTAGRALIDDANAADQRTTLGLIIGTDVQAYDTELAVLAGMVSAADRLPYYTGAGTGALATFTSAGRALVDDADAAAQRTTLGLTIGTNVQAYDAELAAIAGLTSAADAFPYFTGSGTASTATITSTARTVLDDTTTSAMRTTLGLAIGSDVQSYDADLAALGGVTSAADALPYFSGAGTATTTTLTSAARTVLDDTTTSAMRTTLGVAIGTDVQAYDADLGVIAGLADPNADRILFWDDSAGAYAYLTPGTGFLITTTTLGVSGVETIWVPSNSMMPNTTSGCAAATTETTTNDVMVPVCDFDAAARENAQFTVHMPKSWNEGTITAQFSWTAASGTGNVVWGLECLARSDDDAIDTTWGTAVTVTDALTATGDLMISAATSAHTIGGTPAENDVVWCKVYRDAASGSDTFSADASLIGVKILYTVNALTDD